MDEIKARIQERIESSPPPDPNALASVLANEAAREMAGCDNCDAVIKTILDIYDSVAPLIDIPGVPNIFEPKLKDLVRVGLVMLLEKIADALHSEAA